MKNKYKIIKEKEEENIILEQEIIELESECDKYFILQENIDNYVKNKLYLLNYNMRKLEDLLIDIAIIKCIVINDKLDKNSKLYNNIKNYIIEDSNGYAIVLNKFMNITETQSNADLKCIIIANEWFIRLCICIPYIDNLVAVINVQSIGFTNIWEFRTTIECKFIIDI